MEVLRRNDFKVYFKTIVIPKIVYFPYTNFCEYMPENPPTATTTYNTNALYKNMLHK